MRVVAFDAGMLSVFIHPNPRVSDNPATGEPISRIKDRVRHLVSSLDDENATILVPTPALAEFLFIVDEDGAHYLRILNTYRQFDIKEFDLKSAIECAESHRKAVAAHDKRSGATGTYQKSKVDRQILAVAIAWEADTIYTTDTDIVKMAKFMGSIKAVPIWDLQLPSADTPKAALPPASTAEETAEDDEPDLPWDDEDPIEGSS